LTVKVEVLYAPTCANNLMWLERIREALADYSGDVTIEEIDVSERPEALGKYPSRRWQEFIEGYIHYFILVAVDGETLDDWYWETRKIVEAVQRKLKPEG